MIEIPFDIFWNKFLEKGGLEFNRHRSGAIWFVMRFEERGSAFESLSQSGNINEIIGTDYLKGFMK